MPTTINSFVVRGELGATRAKNEGKVDLPVVLDFTSANDIILDFSAVQQQNIFSAPRSVFIDNTMNPSPISVAVSVTGQTFPVPPYAAGYFQLQSMRDSRVRLISTGGATGLTQVTVFNYETFPVVWSGFGPTTALNRATISGEDGSAPASISNPLPVEGAAIIGSAPGNTRAMPLALYDTANNIWRRALADNTGKLIVSSLSAIVGAIYGNDAAGAAPTQAPVYIAGLGSDGKVRPLSTDAGGVQNTNAQATSFGPTAAGVAPAKPPVFVAGLDTAGTTRPFAVDVNGSSFVVDKTGSASSTLTSVAASVSSVVILAGNTSRQGATIYNDGSTATMYVALTGTATVSAYTVALGPGDYYEIPAKYRGAVSAIWDAASGNARVTELN